MYGRFIIDRQGREADSTGGVMRTKVILLQLLVVLGGAACAAGKPPAQSERAVSRRSDRISREEIRACSWTDAYEVVATLRPNWLSDRGRDSFGSGTVTQVVMNGVRMGGVAALRRMPAADIEHFQWHDPNSATTRWGVGFGSGAIELSTTPPR
jgi:hypothetical protein